MRVRAMGLLMVAMLVLSHAALAQDARPSRREPPMRDDGAQRRFPPPTVIVTGQSQVSVEPDLAIVRLGVTAQATEAQAAQNQVNERMQRVLEAIRGEGIDRDDIQTQDLSLHPVYSHPEPRPGHEAEPQEPRITGYRASNVVQVRLEDLGKTGDVIDAGIGAGANQLESLSFQVKDETEARGRALREAVRNARSKAEAIAEAAGGRLGPVREIVEGGYHVMPPQPMFRAGMAMEMAATPVEPGQVDITTSVTATYHLTAVGQAGAGNEVDDEDNERRPPREDVEQ